MPYPENYEKELAFKELKAQQDKVVLNLKVGMVNAEPDREIIALIAYLQRLGRDIQALPAAPAKAAK